MTSRYSLDNTITLAVRTIHRQPRCTISRMGNSCVGLWPEDGRARGFVPAAPMSIHGTADFRPTDSLIIRQDTDILTLLNLTLLNKGRQEPSFWTETMESAIMGCPVQINQKGMRGAGLLDGAPVRSPKSGWGRAECLGRKTLPRVAFRRQPPRLDSYGANQRRDSCHVHSRRWIRADP